MSAAAAQQPPGVRETAQGREMAATAGTDTAAGQPQALEVNEATAGGRAQSPEGRFAR